MEALGKLDHPTAAEIHAYILRQYPKISLGTVYRNLSELAAAGVILRLPSGDGSDRFDCNADEHFHVICTGCGRIFDILSHLPKDAIESLDKTAREHTGVKITGRDISFKGICPDCASR
jgi:Fur family peroxide stress response transcriptional regulator